MAKKKINKVVRQLKKASKTHAGQAKTLESIKMKKGGSAKKDNIPDNVYASGYLVQEYKRMGGKYKGAKKAEGGEMKGLKPIPAANKGLPKLPKKVRNKMGFMQAGGPVMMVQGRGCGAMMQSKRKKTRVPRT